MEKVLLEKYKEEKLVLQLENKDRLPVGSINLDKIDLENLVIVELKNSSEKFLISYLGFQMFFSFWRKLDS